MNRGEGLLQVLQVDAEADQDVIGAAYRRLAQNFHPDHNKAPNAEQRMREINQAYDILKDPVKRAEYDNQRPSSRGDCLEKPEFRIEPDRVLLDDVDTDSGSLAFSVQLVQVSGPAFNPDIHKLRLVRPAPWDGDIFSRIQVSGSTSPIRVEFEIDASRLPPGETLTGTIAVEVNIVL